MYVPLSLPLKMIQECGRRNDNDTGNGNGNNNEIISRNGTERNETKRYHPIRNYGNGYGNETMINQYYKNIIQLNM